MAGRPRTRAKREAERLAANAIPDAVAVPAGANTPPRARARPPRVPLMSGFVGPQTRAAADDLEMQRLRNVAAQIRPGVTVQIERTRPTWCAGYLEDYPIDDQAESFAELRAYVRDNFGGQRFRLTVMSAQGSVLAEGSFPVSAPPKDRGKPIDRHVWEGDAPEPARVATPVQVAAPSSSTDHGLAGVVLEMLRDSNKATIESVKEMTKQTREQTADLIKSVVSTRSEERRERTLASQLGEIVDVTKAVDKVQRQLFGSARGGQQQPADLDAAADREATTFFKKAVIGKIFGGVNEERRAGNAGDAQAPQRRQRVQIPDAGAPPAPNGKGGN